MNGMLVYRRARGGEMLKEGTEEWRTCGFRLDTVFDAAYAVFKAGLSSA